MESWTSRTSGLGADAVHDGFSQHRQFNETVKSAPKVEKGFLTRYLRNRAAFTTQKAAELPTERRNEFADRKVWSA